MVHNNNIIIELKRERESNSGSVRHVEEEFDESRVHVGSSTKTPPYRVTMQVDSYTCKHLKNILCIYH